MKGHTGKDEGRVNWNPNYSYRMVFLTNFLIFLMCTIVLAGYFDAVLSAFDECGLSWKFMFWSALPCPPVIGTIYGLFTMRDIYMQAFGIWGQSSPCERS